MGKIAGVFFKGHMTTNEKVSIKKIICQCSQVALKWEDEDVLIGVSHSKVSVQSDFETGPIESVEDSQVLVAEAILSNRIDLCHQLEIPSDQIIALSDSMLIMKAYSVWGNACFARFVGTFSIVLYNYKAKEITLVRDQIGSSKVYYIDNDNLLAFSSDISSLVALLPAKAELNDLWIANFLTVNTPMHDVISNQTVYKQIHQLDPAYYKTSTQTESELKHYWKSDIYPSSNMSYEEACIALKDKLSCITEGMVQTQGNVGIMLSGGLDSTSVAAFASKVLEKSGKKLYAYTSVPLDSFEINQKARMVQNESDYVNAFLKMYPNIEHKYISSVGKNSITDIEEHLTHLEEPYKFVENYFWLNEILEAAKKDGCTVMLNGGFGNVTISYGPLHERLITLNSEYKFLKSFKTLNQFAKHAGLGRKRAYKYFIELLFKRKLPVNMSYDYENLYVNQELAHSLNLEQIQKDLGIGQFTNQKMTTYDLRNFFMASNLVSQNASNTSCALKRHGIQLLDPTGDLRMIDLCFSLPLEYFIKEGKERQLLRDALAKELPDEIRLNYLKRGAQSADWLFRLEPEMQKLRNELLELLKEPFGSYYFNVEQLHNDLSHLE